MITYTNLHKAGRMGNQLFELACCISTALRNNDKYIFPQWKYEKDFNLHNCFSDNINPTLICNESFFHFQEIPYFDTKNDILDIVGYRQSYKYFDDYEYQILNRLTPAHHFDKEPGLCSIHIRRGDYLNFQDCHPLMTMEYYNQAMIRSECKKFLIFSDDIAWCKKNFIGNQFEFSEGNEPPIDLSLMAKKCESNIICNSSFSWWGGYLNQSPNKKVIFPNNWFGPKLTHRTDDMCPKEWIKI